MTGADGETLFLFDSFDLDSGTSTGLRPGEEREFRLGVDAGANPERP